ncbi:MAG: DUF6431 domain-containing protein [Clostridiales bacterium]|jgi:hypothetical protein|nr:DUF6431 domain-containing protein [Clostridiales bacterium]
MIHESFISPAFTLVKSSGVYAVVLARRTMYGGIYVTMILIADYHMEYSKDKKVIYVRADEILICPVCACDKFINKGWRTRKLILINDDISVLMVRRVWCKGCNKIHHVLPNIIVPYKRHDAETIEAIITGCQCKTFCEESIINRIKVWWRRLQSYIAVIEASTQSGIIAPLKSRLSKTISKLVNANLWPRTRITLGIG